MPLSLKITARGYKEKNPATHHNKLIRNGDISEPICVGGYGRYTDSQESGVSGR